MVEQVTNEFVRIDILVNAAGIAQTKPFMEITEDQWDRVLDINLKSTLFCIQAVAAQMIKQIPEQIRQAGRADKSYGKIVNFSSISGRRGRALQTAYAASKAAAELLCYQYSQTYHLDIVLARPFNHIGPGQSSRFVVSNFAQQIVKIELGQQEPVLTTGNLDVSRDFLDVRDVVDAYRSLLEGGQTGEAYNVSSGKEIRLTDILATLVLYTFPHQICYFILESGRG